jgi:hypothetical protein
MAEPVTILRSAYNVCGYVRQLPFRSSVARLMHRINFSTAGETNRDPRLDDLGMQGRNAEAQFAGYLAALQGLATSWDPASEQRGRGILENNELGLLEQAHQFILDINTLLVTNLNKRIGELIRGPYHQFTWLPPYQGTREYDFDCVAIAQLCQALGQHPACSVISAIVPTLNEVVVDDISSRIQSQVEEIASRIHTGGVEHVSSDIDNMIRLARTDAQRHYKLLAALVALKCSLLNLDQLIYQAFQRDKLPVLDENSVFQVSSGWHSIGHYAVIRAIPTESTAFLEPGDLVLVKAPLGEDKMIDNLYCMGGLQVSWSQDTGYECEYHMRRVDENLNCYERLI